jgi:hypothetical protein
MLALMRAHRHVWRIAEAIREQGVSGQHVNSEISVQPKPAGTQDMT